MNGEGTLAFYQKVKELIPEAKAIAVSISAQTSATASKGDIMLNYSVYAYGNEIGYTPQRTLAYAYAYTEEDAIAAMMADYQKRK